MWVCDPARAVRWGVGHGGRAASAEHVTRRVRSESEQRPGARVCAVRGAELELRSEMSLVTSGDPDPPPLPPWFSCCKGKAERLLVWLRGSSRKVFSYQVLQTSHVDRTRFSEFFMASRYRLNDA